jgi:hypothetical protein
MDGDTTKTALIIAGLAGNILISGGVLWKLIDFARGYGRMEQTVEQQVAINQRQDDEIRELQKAGLR